MPETFDAIVIGAGPAGSTAARKLALAGARVLLLDKASFPREKPCGGGLTFRADDANDLDLSPVTERETYGLRISINMGRRFDRTSPHLLCRMTQRSRLDEYLANAAATAGADFRDGTPVRSIEIDGATARVATATGTYETRVLIGTDGVNGMTASTLGLAPQSEVAVAFEAKKDGLHAYTQGMQKFVHDRGPKDASPLEEFEMCGFRDDLFREAESVLLGLCQAVLVGRMISEGDIVGGRGGALEARAGGLDRAKWEGVSAIELIPTRNQSLDEAIRAMASD